MYYDIECPYCGKEQEIDHDDGNGYQEDVLHEQGCKCGKVFVYNTTISFDYTAYKADCLNGGEHKYKQTTTFPKECTVWRCEDCGEEKNLSDEEMIVLLRFVERGNNGKRKDLQSDVNKMVSDEG